MKNKKMIIALVSVGVVSLLGVGGIFVNAQMQEKQEAIRIAESEAEAEEARLEEAELLDKYRIKANKRLEESQALQIEVNSLFDSEDKELLVAELTQEQIDKVNEDVASFESSILTNAIEGTYISEISKIVDEIEWVLKTAKADLEDVKKMFLLKSVVSNLTLEHLLTEQGDAKLNELQELITELKKTKQVFAKTKQAIIDDLNAQLQATDAVNSKIHALFSDEEETTPREDVTREEVNEAVASKDTITIESLRIEMESRLIVVVNYLDEKDAETAQTNISSISSSCSNSSSSGPSTSNNSGSDSSYSNGSHSSSTYTNPTYENSSSSYVEPTQEPAYDDTSTADNSNSSEWTAPKLQSGDTINFEEVSQYEIDRGGTGINYEQVP